MATYPHAREPYGFRGGGFDPDAITIAIDIHLDHNVKLDSTPGFPYSAQYPTNKIFIHEARPLIHKLVFDRLERLERITPEELCQMSPLEIFKAGLSDPVKVFGKGEPHSTKKVSQKRWRLIMAVSLIDQLIERLIYGTQNTTEIRNWHNCPSAPGAGIGKDEDLATINRRIRELAAKHSGGKIAEADISGFDWSVQEWELQEDAICRALLCDASPWLADLMFNRMTCMARSLLYLPNGNLVEIPPGVMKSGSYVTSSTNSRIRVILAWLVGAAWAYAMGDDCLEDPVENAQAKYAALGHTCKMYETKTTDFEFCSTIFTNAGAWPVDGTKTLYRLLEQPILTHELLFQFEREMRNHPRREEFLFAVARNQERRSDADKLASHLETDLATVERTQC